MLQKTLCVFSTLLIVSTSFSFQMNYWTEVGCVNSQPYGQNVSYAHFSDGEYVALYDGQKLKVTKPCVLKIRAEGCGWLDIPVKPVLHVSIQPRSFDALRSACLALNVSRQRRIILNWPPVSSPWHLPTGMPMLAAVLKQDGHEVIQRYSHIEWLEGALTHQNHKANWALDAIRDSRSDIKTLYEARVLLEKTSQLIPMPEGDKFILLRNNVHYVSDNRDGTIEGVIRAIQNREESAWYDSFNTFELGDVDNFRPDIYGISIADERQLLPGCILASMIKDEFPKTLVVLGGNFWSQIFPAYFQLEFKRFFEVCKCDAIIYREGFKPLQELAATLNPSKVSGTVWRDGDRVVVNPPTDLPVDFESLPTPEFDAGTKQWLPGEPIYPLFTMSNCPFACGFCGICVGSDTCGLKPRAMSPARIAEHMQRLGTHHFDIADETFLIERQLQLGKELKKRGHEATWRCFLNVDNKLLDPKVCHELYEAGCRLVEMGFESLSPETLRHTHKAQNKPENYGRILQNLREAGILTHVFLLLGIPGESLHVGLKWVDFLERYGNSVLTVKAGRYRLVRMSPDGRLGTYSKEIEVMDDNKPFHPNLDFQYLKASRKRVEAMRDILEQACRNHWAYEVTSTIHWADRIRHSWKEFETMALELPKAESIPHIEQAVAKARGIVKDELGQNVQLNSFNDVVEFSRTI